MSKLRIRETYPYERRVHKKKFIGCLVADDSRRQIQAMGNSKKQVKDNLFIQMAKALEINWREQDKIREAFKTLGFVK